MWHEIVRFNWDVARAYSKCRTDWETTPRNCLAPVPPSSSQNLNFRSRELGIGRLVREPETYILSCLLPWAANWQDGEPGEAHAQVKTSTTNFPYSKLTRDRLTSTA